MVKFVAAHFNEVGPRWAMDEAGQVWQWINTRFVMHGLGPMALAVRVNVPEDYFAEPPTAEFATVPKATKYAERVNVPNDVLDETAGIADAPERSARWTGTNSWGCLCTGMNPVYRDHCASCGTKRPVFATAKFDSQ